METLRQRTRHGLVRATAHLTATEGPLRLALDELGRRGIGARVIKGALAASVAWLVAGLVTPATLPFLASLTALFTVQLTIAASLKLGRERLLGVLIGIAVAFAASELLGIHSWSVGLVALGALLVALRLRLEGSAVEQVAATAILVMFVQSTTDARLVYALSYLLDTGIGTAVGLALNALVAPPNYLPAARGAVRSLGERLGYVLEDLAAALSTGIDVEEAADLRRAAERVVGETDDVESALERAAESLRYNVTGSRQGAALEACRETSASVARAAGEIGRLASAVEGAVSHPAAAGR
jgi:uncharacterized membrane protein YgaE (UPF0421/DUF939 family)